MKKVLVIHATGGMGHVTAAKAIVQAFEKRYPDVEIKNVDVLDFSNKVYRRVVVDGYNYTSSRAPKIWGWLYKHYNERSKQDLIKKISQMSIESKLFSYIKGYEPDFVIHTHPLSMALISHGESKNIFDINSAMVVTDFGCHTFWIDPEVEYYFVAADGVKKCLTGHGIDPKKVVVTGIPIEQKFTKKMDKESILKKIGINDKKPIILIVGGQLTFHVLKRVISNVSKRKEVQFLVVAGRDKELQKSLKSWKVGGKSSVKVFGFVDNMEELMFISDLIFTKAGGLTMSECMAMNLPVIIDKVIPGQEEDNVNYLSSKGAAIKVKGTKGIIRRILELVENPEKLKKMEAAAKIIGRPNSAMDLADFIVKHF